VEFLRKPDVRYTLILAAIALAVWVPRLRGPIDLRYDAGVYYILGTSLADGKGYRLLNEPGEPNALQYPPLLPAVVAAEQKMLGTNDPNVVGPWLRWTYFGLFLVYSLAVYRLARTALSPGFAFVATLICSLSCGMIYLSDLLQAELPFATMTVLFAWSADVFGDGEKSRRPGRFTLSALFATAAFLIRSAGVALLAAWIGDAVFRKQWKQAALRCVVAAVPFFAWQAWVSHVRHSPEYSTPAYAYQRAPYQYYNVSYVENLLLVDSFKPELGRASGKTIVKRILTNTLDMPMCVGDTVSLGKTFGYWATHAVNEIMHRPSKRPVIPWLTFPVFSLVCSAAVLAGVLALAMRRRWFVPLYVAGTIFLICLTPWPAQFQRYLSPVAPFLAIPFVIAMAMAHESFAKQRDERARDIGTVAITVLLVLMPLSLAVANALVITYRRTPMAPGESKLFYIEGDWVRWAQAAKWVGENSSEGDVVATSAPHLLYLRTGRRSVLPPMEHRPDDELRLLDSIPVRYMIVGEFRFLDIDSRYAERMVKAKPEAWKLRFTADGEQTRVYERVHAEPQSQPTR
jgi:hypothetical protein